MSNKAQIENDFKHNIQLLTAKADKALDELNKFTKELGLKTLFSLNAMSRVELSRDEETGELKTISNILGMSNTGNHYALLMNILLEQLEDHLIKEPKAMPSGVGEIESMKRAKYIAEQVHYEQFEKLNHLLRIAEALPEEFLDAATEEGKRFAEAGRTGEVH